MHRFDIILDIPDNGKRLDHALFEAFLKIENPEKISFSRSLIRRLIVQGSVFLEKKRIHIASRIVFSGQKVTLFLSTNHLQKKSSSFSFSAENILYEDNIFLVVNKPSGLPTQETLDQSREHLFFHVKKYLAERDTHPLSSVYLGMHHRLDKDTSGALLFTKDKKWNSAFSDLFSQHKIEKNYIAMTHCSPSFDLNTWEKKSFLGPIKKIKKRILFGSVLAEKGLFAHTHFYVQKKRGLFLWIKAQPITGRTHQIRVHLSDSQCPIVGDPWYGRKEEKIAKRLFLHGEKIQFRHPQTQQDCLIHCPVPKEFHDFWDQIKT